MDVTVHKSMPIMKCLGEDLKDQDTFHNWPPRSFVAIL